MDAAISLTQISIPLCLSILLLSYVAIATQHERVVHRRYTMRCPDPASNEGVMEGLSLMTARDPFTKRSESRTQYFTDRTLQLWQDLGRIYHPTFGRLTAGNNIPEFVRRLRQYKNPSFFQNFQPSSQDLPTETYSPSLEWPIKRARKKHLTGFVSGKRGNRVSNTRINRIRHETDRVDLQSRKEGNNMESRNEHYHTMFNPRADVETFSRNSRQVGEELSRQLDPNSEELSLAWTCRTERFWVDLGANVFPRYVSDTRCVNDTCWYGHYHCRPHRIEMSLLVRHYGACVDTRLPVNIRSEYMLSSVEVSSSCFCGRT